MQNSSLTEASGCSQPGPQVGIRSGVDRCVEMCRARGIVVTMGGFLSERSGLHWRPAVYQRAVRGRIGLSES